MATANPNTEMSAAQYLATVWDHRHEWVNGQVLGMSGGTPRHSAVIINATLAVGSRLAGTPCRVCDSNQRISVPATGAYLYADLAVICGAYETAADDALSIVNPRVVFEVLSPTTADYDRGAKFEHYRRLESLADYVLIDPNKPHIVHTQRTPDGWLRRDLHDAELVLESVDLRIPLEAFYANLENVP